MRFGGRILTGRSHVRRDTSAKFETTATSSTRLTGSASLQSPLDWRVECFGASSRSFRIIFNFYFCFQCVITILFWAVGRIYSDF